MSEVELMTAKLLALPPARRWPILALLQVAYIFCKITARNNHAGR